MNDAVRSALTLRVAQVSDKHDMYNWLTRSDVTASMMGPPDFPDHPIPSWDEFDKDYSAELFGSEDGGHGKCFIVLLEDEKVGVVCHNEINYGAGETELDIWLKNDNACGKGIGTEALRLLMDKLHNEKSISRFLIRPSARNRRAIRAYQKVGFNIIEDPTEEYLNPEELDYDDCVVMIREIE